MDCSLDEQTRSGDAGLAGSGEDPAQSTHCRGFEVSVAEHDVCGLAAKLQRNVFEAARGRLVDLLACGIRSGEGDLGNRRMGNKRGSSFIAEARHHIDYAIWHARL